MMRIWAKIELFLAGVINKLENQKISLTGWLISFFAIVFLRNFLEAFSSKSDLLLPSGWEFLFFHSTVFYLCGILILILFAHFLTREKIEKISKIALFGIFLILLPPILDLLVTSGHGGVEMKYGDFSALTPAGPKEIFKLFSDEIIFGPPGLLFGFISKYPLGQTNYNYGVRINCLLIGLFFLWYVFLKTKSVFRVIFALASFYAFIISFFIFPYIFAAILKMPLTPASFHNVSTLNPAFAWNKILFSLFFILVFCLANLWLFLYNKNKYFAILKNLRPTRIIHNFAMLGFGLFLAGAPFLKLNFFDWLLVITAAMSDLFLWLSVVGYNDISDEEIDRISNPQRPLSGAVFSGGEIKSLSAIFLVVSYMSALVVGYTFFILIVLTSFMAYIYSSPPFRLKRFPVVATFLLALAFLLAVFMGYILPSQKSLFDFPLNLSIFVLLAFTFGSTAKDIKDYEGDKSDKIYTIPVIFGQKRGKLIIGFLAFLIFFSAPFLFFQHFKILILPSILAGVLSFWLINRKKYSEKPLFLVYFVYGLFFALTAF